MSSFDFKKLQKMFYDGMSQDNWEAKNYVSKFFIPLTNGEHAYVQGDKITVMPKETMREVYLARFPDDIQKWYKTKTIPRELICDVKKPQMSEKYVNIAPQLDRESKRYKSFKDKTKEGVVMMINFIKEVWCDNNDDQLSYLLKWFSNVLKGNKNRTVIYAKSIEGIGKSTLIDFFTEYVLGDDLWTLGDKDSIISQYNMDLLGKPLVIFEELPVMNKNEWNACDGKLKNLVTGTTATYSDKYVKKIKADNINNYIIITNHKAIKRPDGRRYFMVTLNTKYCNNHKFFAKLRNACFNEKVGYAFYNYLMELDTDDFNSLDMPETRAKLDVIADLLSPIEKFLKIEYLLKNKPIKMKTTVLYAKYECYCEKNGLKSETALEFRSTMQQYGFAFKLISGYNQYRIEVADLQKVADKRKWCHDMDKDMYGDAKETYDDDEHEYDTKNDKRVELSDLSAEEQIEYFQQQIARLQAKPKPDSDSDSEDDKPKSKSKNIFKKFNTKTKPKPKPDSDSEDSDSDSDSEDDEPKSKPKYYKKKVDPKVQAAVNKALEGIDFN